MQFRMDERLVALVGDWELRPPVSKRMLWTRSRLAVTPNGEVPILHLAAREKFGTWDPKEQEPYWLDRDWTNESIENVGLMLIRLPARRTSKYGVPAGTPAYQAAYRDGNREKIRSYQRMRSAQVRAELRAYRDAEKRMANLQAPVDPSIIQKGEDLLSTLGITQKEKS